MIVSQTMTFEKNKAYKAKETKGYFGFLYAFLVFSKKGGNENE